MASLNDYKRHIQALKMEQKIGRIQKELETVDYGDECPLHGENDCAEVRKAYDRGYVSGLYEALTLFKVIEADTPQMDCGDFADRPQGEWIYVTVEEWLRTGRDYGHHCSECDEINKSGKSNFCPNCGAHMKGADDE